MALCLLAGHAAGRVCHSTVGLSFWGGVDPATGRVIDARHPLYGESLAGRILAMPTSRGSSTGSAVLLELLMNGHAPAALVFRAPEEVLTLGALIAAHVFGLTLPVVRLEADAFAALGEAGQARLTPECLELDALSLPLTPLPVHGLALDAADRALLAGDAGTAAQIAMRVVCAMAQIQGAPRLIDATRVHIDGCIYGSPASLEVAERFRRQGARVRVPTTLNAISVEQARWRTQGLAEPFASEAARLADAYVAMGATASFTCAPYLLADRPQAGEVIAWAESNAVVYANSVLGARTAKHADFFDLCLALTGRAPLAGVYLDAERCARRVIAVERFAAVDDSFWPLLGYLAGTLAPDRVPLLTGVAHLAPGADDLKALCAAFATTSAAAMLHIDGVTPEAARLAPAADRLAIDRAALLAIWQQFNAAPAAIDLVAIGSPHASLSECRALADQLAGKRCAAGVSVIVTLGRDVLASARAEGLAARLDAAGVRLHCDICWCSISEPVLPPNARTVMTNSGKYAHYGPALSGRQMRFGALAECAQAALTGQAPAAPPIWLRTD